ncbi:MAG: hypothetical protein MUC96_06505 [Myxococcaceae bacterium]|nr:hypothetical protein [Myxococcaceae bacterium]
MRALLVLALVPFTGCAPCEVRFSVLTSGILRAGAAVDTEFFNCGTEPAIVPNSLVGDVMGDRIRVEQVTRESPRPLAPGEAHRPRFFLPSVTSPGWYRVESRVWVASRELEVEAGSVLAEP